MTSNCRLMVVPAPPNRCHRVSRGNLKPATSYFQTSQKQKSAPRQKRPRRVHARCAEIVVLVMASIVRPFSVKMCPSIGYF
jgi:hypothetical protein